MVVVRVGAGVGGAYPRVDTVVDVGSPHATIPDNVFDATIPAGYQFIHPDVAVPAAGRVVSNVAGVSETSRVRFMVGGWVLGVVGLGGTDTVREFGAAWGKMVGVTEEG